MLSLIILLSTALKNSLPNLSPSRSEMVSQDVVEVVYREFKEKNIKNLDNEMHAVSLLSGVIVGESGLREDIENCKVTGDNGRSVGLGQVMNGPNWIGYTRKEICADRKIQLKISLRVLDTCAGGAADSASIFRCYTAGDRRKDSYIARYENKVSKEVYSSILLGAYVAQVRTRSWGLNYYQPYTLRSHVISF